MFQNYHRTSVWVLIHHTTSKQFLFSSRSIAQPSKKDDPWPSKYTITGLDYLKADHDHFVKDPSQFIIHTTTLFINSTQSKQSINFFLQTSQDLSCRIMRKMQHELRRRHLNCNMGITAQLSRLIWKQVGVTATQNLQYAVLKSRLRQRFCLHLSACFFSETSRRMSKFDLQGPH